MYHLHCYQHKQEFARVFLWFSPGLHNYIQSLFWVCVHDCRSILLPKKVNNAQTVAFVSSLYGVRKLVKYSCFLLPSDLDEYDLVLPDPGCDQ